MVIELLCIVYLVSLVSSRRENPRLRGIGKSPLQSGSSSYLSSFNELSRSSFLSFSQQSSSPPPSSSSSSVSTYSRTICYKALKETVHVPDSCAYRYLKSIASILKTKSPILFTDQASTAIYNFEDEFKQVNVTIFDVFGQGTKYFLPRGAEVASPPKYSNTAKTYLNLDGFERDTAHNSFYYTFNAWNREAAFLQITLSMSIDYDPIFC